AAVAAGLGVGAVVAELLGVSVREVEREAVAAAAALLVAHLGALTYLRRARKQGRLTPNIVVVGATPNASRLIEQALADGSVNVLGIFDD
ncbi:sugar transferase, partial [Acinetobacter pittii]